jgi:hypothetical protein
MYMFEIKQDFLPINKYTRPGTKIAKVKGIVVHWTANENKGADDVMHRRYFGGTAIKAHTYASAHYFVDHNSILQIIPNNEVGYHVGAIRYQADALKRLGSYPNGSTLGVEICVNLMGEAFLTALDQSAQLIAKLLKDNKLGISDLYRHYDITWKSCPKYFTEDVYAVKYFGKGSTASKEWTRFKNLVAFYMKPKAIQQPALKPSIKPISIPVSKPVSKPVAKPVASKSKPTNGKKGDLVKVIYPTPISIRDKADWSVPAIETGSSAYTIEKRVKVGSSYMYELKSGLFITAMDNFVEVVSDKVVEKPKPKPKPVTKVTVKADALNVRKTASASAPILFTAKKGDSFELVSKLASGWVKLKTSKGTGYVNGKYVA